MKRRIHVILLTGVILILSSCAKEEVVSNDLWNTKQLGELNALTTDMLKGQEPIESPTEVPNDVNATQLLENPVATIETGERIEAEDKYSAYEMVINEFKDHGYAVETKDVDAQFLEGERKWVTIKENENLSVYIFESIAQTDQNAGYIDLGGCSIFNESGVGYEISWSSYPHFYKQDNIIVLYVGENKEIMKLLEEQLGEQFAGYHSVE